MGDFVFDVFERQVAVAMGRNRGLTDMNWATNGAIFFSVLNILKRQEKRISELECVLKEVIKESDLGEEMTEEDKKTRAAIARVIHGAN